MEEDSSSACGKSGDALFDNLFHSTLHADTLRMSSAWPLTPLICRSWRMMLVLFLSPLWLTMGKTSKSSFLSLPAYPYLYYKRN
jgi:hypothetical protein